MADLKRINGNILSWGSGVFKVEGERFFGLIEASYGDKVEVQHIWGQQRSQAPRARTRGKYDTTQAKIKAPLSTVSALIAKLASLSPDQVTYGQVEFQAVFQYSERNEPVITDELIDCRIVEISNSHTEGAEGLMQEVTVDFMRLKRNGLVLFDSSEEE